MVSVAASWDLYEQTKSAVVLGNVGLVQVAPFLAFALIAGHIADRFDRRLVMLGSQVLILIPSLLLAALPRSVGLVYGCLFLIATGRALGSPARSAVLPDTVPPQALQTAITWNSTSFETANVGGPALAGILIAAVGSSSVYFIQCACALLVAASFWLLRAGRGRVVPPPGADHRPGLLDGLRFLREDRLILPAMALDLFAVLFGGAVALLPIFAVEIIGGGAHALGWLRAAPSFGSIFTTFLIAHAPRISRAGRVLLAAVAGFGVATIAFGLSRTLWASLAALALTGAFDTVSVVLRQSLVQGRTPAHLRGRVLAVNGIFINCSNQLGAVESGWTAAWMGPVGSVLFGGAGTLAVAALFSRNRSLREWKE
jgi:MFS family permease